MLTYISHRLIKMAGMATSVISMPIVERPEIEDWVHDCRRFVVIGEAAHPLTVSPPVPSPSSSHT